MIHMIHKIKKKKNLIHDNQFMLFDNDIFIKIYIYIYIYIKKKKPFYLNSIMIEPNWVKSQLYSAHGHHQVYDY